MVAIPKVVKDNKVVYFGEGVWKTCFYEYLGYRSPSRGEFYLSGAVVQAYRAYADLEAEYHIVKPTFSAVSVKAWERGEEIVVKEM